MPRAATSSSRTIRTLLAGAVTGALALATVTVVDGAADPADAAASATAPRRANVVTPGNFTGYGFDQCLAPSQSAMERWLQTSPFLAVGIYISGDSRGCRSQPNLTPTWIRTQLARGWRLLPITLGPQASCQPRFPRYGDDETIKPRPGRGGRYAPARRQGGREATKTVGVARDLGIAPGSTLWYDLEGFDVTNTRCRESALSFLSGWTGRIRQLGYVSGVYSSAGSGIKMLDDARVNRPGRFRLPDQIWIARWDGLANTSTSYVRSDGWQPHARVKQYQGGHNETWGGVTINIDRNYLDVGRGSVAVPERHCGGVRISFARYEPLPAPGTGPRPRVRLVKALQCLLTEQHAYDGRINGRYGRATVHAARAWEAAHRLPQRDGWWRRHWIALLAAGNRPVVKIGSASTAVRRLQRALKATSAGHSVRITGVFDGQTGTALRAWQKDVRVAATGVAGRQTWRVLARGRG